MFNYEIKDRQGSTLIIFYKKHKKLRKVYSAVTAAEQQAVNNMSARCHK